MASQLDSSSSPPPQATTDGSSTSFPKSDTSSKRKKRNGNLILSLAQEREVARLYREGVGTAAQIAAAYNISLNTVYLTLKRQKVGLHYPALSRSSSEAHAKRRAEKGRRADEIEPHLLAEQPSPLPPPAEDGVDIDAVHKRAQEAPVEPSVRPKRKYSRRKKNWFQKMWKRYFG